MEVEVLSVSLVPGTQLRARHELEYTTIFAPLAGLRLAGIADGIHSRRGDGLRVQWGRGLLRGELD
jgi:hypothetical protein